MMVLRRGGSNLKEQGKSYPNLALLLPLRGGKLVPPRSSTLKK